MCCIGLLVLLSTSMAAQRLHIDHYDDLDGLPSRNVHGVEQAQDGRMWFSTRLGLCTYDGYRWAMVDWPLLSPPGLLESGDDGSLWVMPRNGPLVVARYHQGEWSELPECPERVLDYSLFALAGIDSETAFVGARDQGLIGFVDGEWSRY
jgi:ligand-binding sensor domain-containing protein